MVTPDFIAIYRFTSEHRYRSPLNSPFVVLDEVTMQIYYKYTACAPGELAAGFHIDSAAIVVSEQLTKSTFRSLKNVIILLNYLQAVRNNVSELTQV